MANTVQRTQSLRSSHPHIDVPNSICWKDDREQADGDEEYPASIWSDKEFDFDDLIVNSKAYRRVFAVAKAGKQPANQAAGSPTTDRDESPLVEGDLIEFSDNATITASDQSRVYGATQDLAGLTLTRNVPAEAGPKIVVQPSEQREAPIDSSVHPLVTAPAESKPERPKSNQALPMQVRQTTEDRLGLVRRKPLNSPPPPVGFHLCQKCNKALSGQFVRALGCVWHLGCFTCSVSRNKAPVNEESSFLTNYPDLR